MLQNVLSQYWLIYVVKSKRYYTFLRTNSLSNLNTISKNCLKNYLTQFIRNILLFSRTHYDIIKLCFVDDVLPFICTLNHQTISTISFPSIQIVPFQFYWNLRVRGTGRKSIIYGDYYSPLEMKEEYYGKNK